MVRTGVTLPSMVVRRGVTLTGMKVRSGFILTRLMVRTVIILTHLMVRTGVTSTRLMLRSGIIVFFLKLENISFPSLNAYIKSFPNSFLSSSTEKYEVIFQFSEEFLKSSTKNV